VIENKKKRKYGKKKIVYINLHIAGDTGMEFTAC